MSYELILRASYENNKEVLYKSPNINGDFVIRGYTSSTDAPPLHRAGIINDACFNLLSSTNTYPNVSIDTINTSNATLASEDFTISFWCNIQKDSVAQNTVLFSATDGHNYSWSTTKGTFLLLGNPVRLLYDNTTYLTSKNTLKLVDGKNHFICIERKNDTFYVFIDGKLEIEDDIATRFGVAHYPFANVNFSVGNGDAEDSDGTRTLKRSMLVDGYTLIKGICIWDKEFTPPKRDTWDLISNGYLDTTGLAYYHNKIVEYINKNSSVRQNNHLYNKGEIVKFNNVWIKCMLGGTTASTPPTLTTEEIGATITDGRAEWEIIAVIESSNKILDWKPKKGYNKGEMVYYDNILYKAKANITSGADFTQEQNNWELVCTQIPEWTSSCYYVQGAIVEHNNKIYKCKTTNSDVAFTESNWTNIGGGSSVEEWKPKKQYNTNDIVINDNKLYLCIQRNMSTDSFEDDTNYWVLLSATEHNNYGQVNKLGAKKGDTFDVSVQKTATFSFPPVEVLKLSGVTKGVSKNIFDYNSGDGNKFTVNNAVANKSKFIIFDGVAKPNNEYKYALGDYTKMTTNYYRVSEEIDPSEFKTFEKVELIE